MNIEYFHKHLDSKGYAYEVKDGVTVVTHQGVVYLDSLASLPPGTQFRNKGAVYLFRLTSLPPGTQFRNKGVVYLDSLASLPPGTQFRNEGVVGLRSLTSETQIYRGKTIRLRNVDGYTMQILSERKKGDITLIRARYFGGDKWSKDCPCWIASEGEYNAHGRTPREAIQDLQFKILNETADRSEIAANVVAAEKVTRLDYRLLTGACWRGIEHFIEEAGIDPKKESIPLNKALALTANQYGGDAFREAIETARAA